MQTASSNQKRDIFQSKTLSKGYFYDFQIDDFDNSVKQKLDSKEQIQLQQSLEPQKFISPQSKQLQKITQRQFFSTLPFTEQITPKKVNKRHRLKNPKDTIKRKEMQKIDIQVDTLDDEELKAHDQIIFNKQSVTNKKQAESKSDKIQASQFDSNTLKKLTEEVEQKIVSKEKKEKVVRFDQSPDDYLLEKQQKKQPSDSNLIQEAFRKELLEKESLEKESLEKESLKFNNSQVQKPQTSKKSMSRENFLQILTFPIKKSKTMRTYVQRVNSIFNSYPEFHVFFEADKTHLMSAKRVSRSPSSTFIISTSKDEFTENSSSYLGKAKGSVLGDELNLFGPSLNPRDAFRQNVIPRQLLATIVYETRIFFAGQPRNFKIYIKKQGFDYYKSFPEVQIYGQEIPLSLLYQNPHNRDKIVVLKNKIPEYNANLKGYSLRFGGRVNKPSNKNFILQMDDVDSQKKQKNEIKNEQDLEERVLNPRLSQMIFGKVEDNKFSMDISYPLSPLVAFGIALSSFDEKYFCE